MWENNTVKKLSNDKSDVEAFINVKKFRDDMKVLNFKEDEVQKYVNKFSEKHKFGPIRMDTISPLKPTKSFSLGDYMAEKVK